MTDYTVPVEFRMVGLAELKEANAQLKRMAGSGGTVARATKETAKASMATRNYGNVAQNASYQVQDLIVQIQSGQDPLRALGQQLPQLTVGMGAWGAAIGVVAAAIPALVTALRETEEVTVSLDEAVGSIGQTFDTIDMSNYARQFLEADEATRQLMSTTLEYQKTIAALDVNRIAGELLPLPAGGPSGPGTGGRTSGPAAREGRFDRAAESLGLFEEQLKSIQPLYEAILDDETRNADTLAELNQQLQQFVINGDIRNDNIRTTIEQIRGLEQAYRILETADSDLAEQLRTQTNAALREQWGLLEEIKVTAQEVANTYDANLGFDTGIFAAENAQIQDQAWLNAIDDIINPLEEDLPEAFSLAAASAEIFGRTFETALNGVAMGTQDLSDAVTNMVRVIIVELGKLAAYQAIASAFSGTSFGNAAASLLPSAKGNVFAGGDVVPFAKGGVVSRPTIFPFSRGVGIAGEAGPEAILPLGRNSRGELGVKSEGINVIVNNNAPGVAVNPRPSDDGLTIDIVMAQVSAAIDRGGNLISNSIERNYNVGRGRGVY